MSQVRSFVGHSFSPDDLEVVGKFTKYLNQISLVNPNFSWQHAEVAEPRVVDEKVLRLFDDKDLFIGICTKKERVIKARDLRKVWWGKSQRFADEQAFEWKTSDWIIQEIGLAIGLGIPAILLVEEGLRSPGTLQGNLEHIKFDRAAPEQSFGKLLEMISAFTPRSSSAAIVEVDARSSPPTIDTSPNSDRTDWTIPAPHWKRRDYEIAYMHFTAIKENDKANAINDNYLESESGTISQNIGSWTAFREYIWIAFGSGGSLPRLWSLAQDKPGDSEILRYLAKSYEEYEEFEKAAGIYDEAANVSSSLEKKLSFLSAAAVSYKKSGKDVASKSVLNRMKEISASNGQGESEVLETEYKIAEMEREFDVVLGAMERLLDLNPSDINRRFSLAYQYSERNSDELSIFHYLKIPFQERTGVTWNNIGVAEEQLNLHVHAVSAFRRAEEVGETLAMSNLANKLLRAGFRNEAQAICDTALKMKDYHKNIGRTLDLIKSAVEDDNKKEIELVLRSKTISDFYREFGSALAKTNCNELPTRWKGPVCSLQISIVGDSFVAKGVYSQSSGGLRGLMSLGLGGAIDRNEPTSVTFTIEFAGTIKGRGVVGSVVRKRQGEPEVTKSLLGSGDESQVALLVINDTKNQIQVFEKVKGSNRFYEFNMEDLTN